MRATISLKDPPAETFPLTPMQHGMLLDSLRAARDGVYVQQLVCTFRESLNVTCFRAAWQWIVDRHAVLRTCFHLEDRDEPIQEFRHHLTWELEQTDWRELGVGAAEQRLEAYLGDDRRRGFDLEQPPLWRLNLFRLADDDYRLLWTSHHALLDGRSRLIVLRELFARYDGLVAGTTESLRMPRSFGDHVRAIQTRDFSGSQGYWQALLRGFRGATPLPECNARTIPAGDESHRTAEICLTEECTRALEDLAHECRVTLNTVLQGAWALLLSYHSGFDDVVFGATRACRHSSVSGAASMVGLFVNTLPVRTRVRGSALLSDWLRELRSQWLALREHEQTPLTLVHRWSEVRSGQPLFDSLVVFEKLGLDESLKTQGNAWENREVRVRGITSYPLVVAGFGGARLRIQLTYDRRRFTDEAIERIQNRLQTVLEGMTTNKRGTLAELPVISRREEQRLIRDWNATGTNIPRDASVPLLFEAQVARRPEAIALVVGDRHWTYQELNGRANRLARSLREQGVGLETPVAILAERSPEMVVGILAVLKTGGAYVPLDPAYPEERIRFILSDTRAPVILTQESLMARVPAQAAHVLCLDAGSNVLDSGEDPNVSCPAMFDSLAYIMYTSGSTGTPKGVAVPHRGIIRLILGVDYVQLDSTRKILHLASPAFDASTFELWGPLLHGGQCVLYQGRVPTLDVLGRVLREHEVDTLFLTSALFHAVVDESVEILRGVKQLLVGGDVLSVDHVRRARACLPETEIINGYGPTETTTFATCYRISGKIPDDAWSLPIGVPIGNTSTYLLDALGRPVPVGVPGELYIGGPGVARCYWNQPKMTAQRFLPDRFGTDPAARLYRTGDLGRYLEDGNIEFLGRLDGQVKVRGFRIELGEVEAALRRHGAVRDVIVVPVEERATAGRRLAAYIVPSNPPGPTAEELRGFLRTILPEYMMPSAFLVLDELPLSPNGKVDRGRLPAAAAVPRDPEPAITARTPVEARLAGIFADLLGRDRLSVQDDFFELGGHSLLALQAASRVRQAFGVELPITILFDQPTVAGLAKSVEALVRTEPGESEPPMLRVARPGAFPLLSSQLSIWDLHRRHPGKSLVNPSRAYRLRGPLSVDALREALSALVERHEGLRTRFVEIDGSPAQIIGAARPLDLPLTDLSRLTEASRIAEAHRQFDAETRQWFDLANGPVFRPRLLRLDDEDHVLILIFNHIVLDGWSLGIFNAELSVCYDAIVGRKRLELPPLPIQPADVACWEQRYFQSAAAQRQVAYWRDHLSDAPLTPGIAGDGPKPEPGDFRAVVQSRFLPPNQVEAIRDLGRQEGCTLSMTLLAAVYALFHEATGAHDFRVGLSLSARTRPAIEGLIGCFRKRVTLRTNVSGRPTFRELLRRVREVSVGAYLHLDLSQEIVFPEWGVDHPAHWTHVPINFNYFERSASPLKLSGLAVLTIDRPSHYMWMTMSLHVFEQEDGIRVDLMSRSDLFSAEVISELLEGYCTLLRRVVSDSNQRLAAGRP